MIEKLKGYITDTTMIRKIDELVDAVNAIQKEREAERFEIQEWIGILEAVRKSVNIHEKQIDKLQMKVEPEKLEIDDTDDIAEVKNQVWNIQDYLKSNDDLANFLESALEENDYDFLKIAVNDVITALRKKGE